ncbi:unnamed protein product [Effrenium voratum]|nr:unnamed protein product [Effrenium voratum]
MEWFSNPAAEVRESAVRLMAACYAHVGLGRIEKYLANLRQAQREVFDAEFQRVSGKAPREPARLEPPPQKAMPEMVETEGRQETSEDDFEEFWCQFCGREDPSFTLPALDVHYWRECPMLSACKHCEQVIEISRLHWHLSEERVR